MIGSRLLVWAAGLLALGAWGASSRAADFDPAGTLSPYGAPLDTLVAPAARWDSVWYLAVAHSGYGADPARAAFFPLYPLLLRALGSDVVAGVLLSIACLAVATLLLHRLTALELGPEAAAPAVLALALFPGSLYCSMVYSEALFLALSLGAVYAARTGRWAWAGALGALGAATRSAGVVLLVPLVLLWWAHSRRARDGAWLALVPLGLAAFCARAGAGRARRARAVSRAGALVSLVRRAVHGRLGRHGRRLRRRAPAAVGLALAGLLRAAPAAIRSPWRRTT